MQIDKDELLNQAKESLKDEVTQIAFQTWFSSMEITEMTENNIVLKASSQYGKEMLETRYADLVLNTFKFITNKDWTFSVICDENGKKVEGGEVSYSNTSIDSQDGDIEISNKTLLFLTTLLSSTLFLQTKLSTTNQFFIAVCAIL